LSWKKAVSVSLVLLLLILTIGNVKVVAPNNTPIEAIAFTSSQYTEHNPITITSNADLASQGFPGNGSASNPYLIEGYSIETSGECISISDTDVSVLIRNCLLTMGSIDLYNVANLSIRQNIIKHQGPLDSYVGCGISIRFSTSCTIEQNEISGPDILDNIGSGISLQYSTNCTIEQNEISEFNEGIYISENNNTQISENRIYCNDVGMNLRYSVINATLYSNYIGWNELNAEDAGFANQWDDNISHGNYWSDYDGSGIYEIIGSASSADRYPSLWDEDFLGPDISCEYSTGRTVLDCVCTAPRYTIITANVTDLSGVDCVYFVLNNGSSDNPIWVNYTMDYSPISNNPNRYIYNYTSEDIEVNFYILATDTLGYYEQTLEFWLFVGIPVQQPVSPYGFGSWVIMSGIFLGIITLVIVYWYKKLR